MSTSMLLDRETLLEPYYEVHINGQKLGDDLKQYITNVEVEESDSEADLGRVTVADRDFLFSNYMELTKKAPISIYMGHKKNYRLMLKGEITHIEADFGEDGVPYLTIGAIDNTNIMTTKKKSRKWKNKRISEIVRAIAKEYGFKDKVTDTTVVVDEVTQENETDAQLLAKLADEEAFKVYVIVETNELYFGRRITDYKASSVLSYNKGDSSLINFRPTFVEKNKSDNTETKNSDISSSTGSTVSKSGNSVTTTPSTSSKAGGTSPSTGANNSGISTRTGQVLTSDSTVKKVGTAKAPTTSVRPNKNVLTIK